MNPVQLNPQKIFEEVFNFNKKLSEGVSNLRNIPDIPSGVTEKEIVYTEDKLVLYRYINPTGKKATNKIPILVSYALVNRPYMTDLQPNRSIIRGLMDSGQDVYLIDWGYPDRSDRFLNLDDYINGYIDRCVDVLRERHKVENINLLGICQGGSMSICYTAMHTDKIKNLITMVTPVDFHAKGSLLAKWIKKIDVDKLVDTVGNVSGKDMNSTFLNLQPHRLQAQKYIDMVQILDNPQQLHNFMHMEKWIFDSPDQAGEAYRQFIKDFYQENKLVKGGLFIGDTEVKLKDIKCPVLNVYALADNLVSTGSSTALKKYISSTDYEEVTFKGGHIGIYVSGRAQREIPPKIGEWLNER